MITTVGKEEGQYFVGEDIENFPCEDLRTLDQLWVNYSKTPEYSEGKFGFSAQKKIWLECYDQNYDENYDTKERKLGDALGWRDIGKGEYNMIYDFSANVPRHLSGKLSTFIYEQKTIEFYTDEWISETRRVAGISSLMRRFVTCKL